MASSISPRNEERPFEAHELFFSTTDRKGLIRSGNQVFVRVSGHPLERLLSAPHNIIRHPDMPRVVFRLLWSYLQEGRPFAGFVKNMAADGAYYWVMALVVPVDGGYLSVRLKPSTSYLPIVRDLYSELLTVEREADTDGGARRDGMLASGARLNAAVTALGFASYDEFMRVTLAAELVAHQQAVAAWRSNGVASNAPTGELGASLEACLAVESRLDDLLSRVDVLLTLIKQLGAAATFVRRLASDIHLIAFNALIGACRLERGGEGLSVVTEHLARLSQECTDNVQGMSGHLRDLSASLDEMAFSVMAARLQTEMTGCFVRELASSRSQHLDKAGAARLEGDLRVLTTSMLASTTRLAEAAPKAREPVAPLARRHQQLESDLQRLSSLHMIGAIQAVRIPDASMFRDLLDRIVEQLRRSKDELERLGDGVATLRHHLPVFERTATAALSAAESLRAAS